MRPCVTSERTGWYAGGGVVYRMQEQRERQPNQCQARVIRTINIYGAFLCKEFDKEMNVRLSSSVYLVVQF